MIQLNAITAPKIPVNILTPVSPNISYTESIKLEALGFKSQFHLNIAASTNRSPTNMPKR